MKVFTLSSAAIDRLGAMAEERGTSRSGLIEALIFEASTAGAAAETVPVEGRRRKRSEIVR
jgi:hypothetical protein